MIGRWFGAPHGSHRVPAPDSLLGQADRVRAAATEPAPVTRTVRVLPAVPPLVDTVTFDTAGSWAGPLPTARKRQVTAGGYTLPPPPEPPAAAVPPVVLPEAQLPVPSHIYPPVTRDPGPLEYARLMRRVSALTGTTSSFDAPGAWPARQLTAPPATPRGVA